jgi:putative flippase GtrA
MTTVLTRAEQRGASFSTAMDAVVQKLPWGLSRLVPASFLGFVVINGFTFGVDLALLTVLRSAVQLPLWLSVTIAYCAAFGLSYVLNRALNFRSHAASDRRSRCTSAWSRSTTSSGSSASAPG